MKVGDRQEFWDVLHPPARFPSTAVFQNLGGLEMGLCTVQAALLRLGQLRLGVSRFGGAVGRHIILEKKKKSSGGLKTREERLKVSCEGLEGRGQGLKPKAPVFRISKDAPLCHPS